MSEGPVGPFSIELSEEHVEALKNGETVEVLVEKRDEKFADYLEVEWGGKGVLGKTTIEERMPHLFGPGAPLLTEGEEVRSGGDR